MIAIGGKKRFIIGSWILASLLLVGYNGATLVTLFNPQLVERSDEVKLASRKWKQLKQGTSQDMEILRDFNLDLILSKFVPGHHIQEGKSIDSQGLNGKAAFESILPPLTGIMRLSNVHGSKRMLAVIDGNAYSEGAQVQGFTIQEITEKGVGLTRAGTSWFVQTPEVYFSLDKSGSAFKGQTRILPEEETSPISK